MENQKEILKNLHNIETIINRIKDSCNQKQVTMNEEIEILKNIQKNVYLKKDSLTPNIKSKIQMLCQEGYVKESKLWHYTGNFEFIYVLTEQGNRCLEV